MFDYSERRHANRNRPKTRNTGVVFFAIAGALVTVFALGFASGWFAGKATKTRASESGAGTGSAASVPNPSPPAPGVAGGVDTPSLTFYETLPKGGKAVIGTGLNPGTSPGVPSHIPEPAHVSEQKAPEVKEPEASPPKTVSSRVPPAPLSSSDPAPVPVPGSGTKYTVQVSSYQSRQEAESARDKLVAKGLPAYVKESHNKEKGMWYRVRIGRALDHKDAVSTAAKAGNGAFAVPE